MRKFLLLAIPALFLAASLPARAADAPPDRPGAQFCKDNPAKCEEMKKRREAFCKDNPQTCESRKEAMKARKKHCDENPEECQKLKDERAQRMEKREERHQKRKERMEQHRDGTPHRDGDEGGEHHDVEGKDDDRPAGPPR